MNSKILFTCMLFFAISCRILVSMFAIRNFAIGATLIVIAQYLCMLFAVIYCFQHPREFKINKHTKYLLFLFLIYSIYCFVYAFVDLKVPSRQFSKVPDNPTEMIRGTLSIGIMMALACMYRGKVLLELFSKLSVILIVLSLLIYFSSVDYMAYAYLKTLNRQASESYMASTNILSGLTLGGYIGTAYICNLWLIDKWTKYRLANWIIFIIVALYLLFVLLVVGERGPVLFTIITSVWFFLVRSNKNGRKSMIFILLTILFVFMGDYIIYMVSMFAPHIIDRFLSISDDMGSGRMGENSVYAETIDMILENPLFGNYFRLTSSNYQGIYPHNILLEFLVTFGFFFSIPLFLLMARAIKNAYFAISNKEPMALFALLFFHTFCCLMTSDTVLLETKFWTMFAVALSISPKRKKDESPRKYYNY